MVKKVAKKRRRGNNEGKDEVEPPTDPQGLQRLDSVSTTIDSTTPSPALVRSQSDVTEPYQEYYSGGVSQWRDYAEHEWGKNFAWPPGLLGSVF